MRDIITNKIKCNHCDDIIESKNRHDFKRCKCKTVYIDGGLDYLKRGFKNENDYTDLSKTVYDDIKKVVCIQGFSSSGKDSIATRVSDILDIPILVSHTSRPMRDKEINGYTYHFVDKAFFNLNTFLEERHYDTIYGTWKYGLHSSEIVNKPYSIFIVDRQGYEQLKDTLGEDKLISIFIDVPEEELRNRQSLRGDSVGEFERRLKSDIEEFSGYISDYVVYNDKLEDAVRNVKQIILDEISEDVYDDRN